MPNYVDRYVITVLTFYPAAITSDDATQTVGSGGTARWDFMYKIGWPTAHGNFLLDGWYADSSRTTRKGGPTSPVFNPTSPTIPAGGAVAEYAAADTYQSATFQVTAPRVEPSPESTPGSQTFEVWFARITIQQQNFNRNTGQIII